MAKKSKKEPRETSPRSSTASGRGRRLKVFRTPIGFHDAYVAAPSQKAALEAWGADSNIFAQGIAEQVDDPELMEEPLANPGKVIKRVRGSADEHFAALGKGTKKEAGSRIKRGMTKTGAKPKPKPIPKPSRAELDAAEGALEKLDKKQRKKLREIEDETRALERRRRELQRKHETDRDALVEKRDRARTAYERALEAWKSSSLPRSKR